MDIALVVIIPFNSPNRNDLKTNNFTNKWKKFYSIRI